jgi:hypothetical protein
MADGGSAEIADDLAGGEESRAAGAAGALRIRHTKGTATLLDRHASLCKVPKGHPIRDVEKMSGKTIGAVRSGNSPVPLKRADLDRLAPVLAHAEALAKDRDRVADDAALAPCGEVDPVDWSVEAVRKLMAERDRGTKARLVDRWLDAAALG